MSDFASEGGHFYAPDGTPRYTIIGKNGKERNTTLADARKEGLYPSVTNIIRCAAAPGLENWKAEQLLMAALTLPKLDGESEKDWLVRVRTDSKAEGREAAEIGTKIHGAIEQYYRDQMGVDAGYLPYVHGVISEVTAFAGAPGLSWQPEKSFASSLGYGGKVDLHGNGFVIDFKGKDFGPEDELVTYDEHHMQLAAYREGLGMPQARCAICYFSRTVPGLAKLIELDEAELQRGWSMFHALLKFWQAQKGYNP